MPTTRSFEVDGDGAIQAATAVLDRWDETIDYEDVEGIRMEIDIAEVTIPSHSQSNGDEQARKLQQLGKEDTKIHKVLSAIEDHGPARCRELEDRMGLGYGSIQTASSDLYYHRLVDREKVVESDGNWGYSYGINKYGEAELDRLGRADYEDNQ